MNNPILNYLRRNKHQCVKCKQWEISSNKLVGGWCLGCIIDLESKILKQIGTVLAIRIQGRSDFVDVSEFTRELLNKLPRERRNKPHLWSAFKAAEEYDELPT